MQEAVAAIEAGDVEGLAALLDAEPGLASAYAGDEVTARTLLHVATDWPGHRPRVGEVIRLLVDRGADVDARFVGPHTETPLHWAASSDDVEALDALLDLGASIDADGAVLGGGTPLADARGFAQWRAAARLLERGATTTLADEATLGLLDRLRARIEEGVGRDELDLAFWHACHGGAVEAARLLAGAGAALDVVPPWEPLTPLDAARRRVEEEPDSPQGRSAASIVAWLS